MFDNKARVTQTVDGCQWYEQDIVLLDYIYTGDCIVDIKLKYNTPGFGILLAEADGNTAFDSGYSLLYRIGDQSYTAEERSLGQVSRSTDGAFPVRPNGEIIHLIFYKTSNCVWMTYTYQDTSGNTIVYGNRNLGNAPLAESLESYRIGFYSNAGNVLEFATISTDMPSGWVVNIHNTNGGRVFFLENGFTIEDCEYHAELEQQNIYLESGTYYVDYIISDDSDIESYIIPVAGTHLELFDDRKNILQEDRSFTLEEAGYVNLKFAGTHGTVYNICIKDLKDSVYVETEESPIGGASEDGSLIRIDLTKVKEFTIEASITSVPEYELTEQPPYYIVKSNESYILSDFSLDLNTTYTYTYSQDTHTISVNNQNVSTSGCQELLMFYNINAVITKFIVTYTNGQTNDILHSDTYKHYVVGEITVPILVTDLGGEPYDLSSSYREVIQTHQTIDLFNIYTPLSLSHRVNPFAVSLRVYGIPASAKINKTKQTIEEFASEYIELSTSQYTYDTKSNELFINDIVRKSYKYIAAVYKDADTYLYTFTNWEREIFPANNSIIEVTHKINNETGHVIVYGIPNDEPVYEDYIYRIPESSLIHSIDMYARQHDTILENAYTVNYEKNRIHILSNVQNKYKIIVVDYLKENSYTVNLNEDMQSYELDISSSDPESYIIYDMDENGQTTRYEVTDIKPTQDKYIVLTRKEDSKI